MNFKSKVTLCHAGVICVCFVSFTLFNSALIFADDLTAANDTTGAGSSNQAEASVSQQTAVQASNQSNVVNVIDLNLNTGQNQASQNQTGATASTGDISVAASVQTQTNHNQVDLSAGQSSDSSSQVLNHQTGADSSNQASLNSNSQTQITTSNHQTVTNLITVNADTGHNQASQNGGQVNLSTGDIQIDIAQHTSGNLNQISLPGCTGCSSYSSSQLINHKTGFDSHNLTGSNFNRQTQIFQTNQSSVLNTININADTGHNQIQNNHGPVIIDTGSVNIGVALETVTNLNEVVWETLDTPTPPDDVEVGGPDDSDQPDQPDDNSLPAASGSASNNSSGGSNSSSGGSSPAAIGGQILGAVLPATGNPYSLFMWMFGLFLISMGRFVRLNAGRSPAYILSSRA